MGQDPPAESPAQLIADFQNVDISTLPIYDPDRDDVWEWYNRLALYEARVEELIAIEELDPTVTRHHRLLEELTGMGEIYLLVLAEIYERDTVATETEREQLMDVRLTIRQQVASFYVDLGRCEIGQQHAAHVMADPGLITRGNVRTATEITLEDAAECLAEQEASGVVDVANNWMPARQMVYVDTDELRRRTGPIAFLTAGGLVLGGGAALLIAANGDARRHNRLLDSCFDEACSAPEIGQLADRIELRRNTGMALALVGSASAVAGIAWILAPRREDQDRQTGLAVAPASFREGTARYYGGTLQLRW